MILSNRPSCLPVTTGITKRSNWSLIVGLLLLLAAIFWGQYKSPDSLDDPLPRTIDLRNLHQVHSYLWRGGFPSFDGLKQLKKLGFTTVIDLRSNPDNIKLESMECQVLGLQYISLPTANYHIPSPRAQATFLSAVQEAKDSQGQKRIFLHCSHGSDRTGYLIALLRLKQDGYSPAAAAYELLRYGFLFHQIRWPWNQNL